MPVRPSSRSAAARGHQVAALRSLSADAPIPSVTYVQGDATDEATLSSVIEGSDIVVDAIAPRGPLVGHARDVHRTIARLANAAGVTPVHRRRRLVAAPCAGADRFVTDPSHLSLIPAELHDEIRDGAAFIIEDLPATPRHSTGST